MTSKTEMNNELNLNDMAITIEVDGGVIEDVRNGEIRHMVLEINGDNQESILETVDGHLALTVDELPDKYYGCYYYNNGEFPYNIKDDLHFLILSSDEEDCLVRIIDVETEAAMRFNYNEEKETMEEDPDGECCVWEVAFEIVPMPEDAKTYLMRWNPQISSFTEKDYKECLEDLNHVTFRMNWSIREWEEARRGDMFYMLRIGDDKAGIVFRGQFLSDPYPGDDWAGSNKRRMYVDMICDATPEAESKTILPLEKLHEAIPEIDWGAKGSSGVLLPETVTEKLEDLWEE